MTTPDTPTTIAELQDLINTYPTIDNHAHNLLRDADSTSSPLESIVSEASGLALNDATRTLAHARAITQLSSLLGCAPTWEAIKDKRKTIDYDAWTRKCLSGTQCLLIDDGLDGAGVHPYNWHDRYTSSPSKRLVRIETLAEQTLREFAPDFKEDENCNSLEEDLNYGAEAELFNRWSERFAGLINAAVQDPAVAGFKSIVCYRSGLDITNETTGGLLLEAVKNALRGLRRDGARYKIRDKILGDFLVSEVARIIAKSGSWKPLQFHTGLGDNDLNIRKANPAYLQYFIKENPDVPIVLLHSSYPFTREAGYLASVYKNVYLDIGEVFPMISKDGQKSVIKQCLECTPSNKLLWSTDGHWFPEGFALANMQIREVLGEVLSKRVAKGQLTVSQAGDFVKDLLFENSNKLYKLNLTPIFTPTMNSVGHSLPINQETQILAEFLYKNPHVKYFRLQWVDYTNTLRLRLVTLARMNKMVSDGTVLTVTKAVLSLLQDDTPTNDFTPAGRYNLVPDWSSLRICPGESDVLEKNSKYASVMCFFRDDKEEVDTCPRTILSRAVLRAKEEHRVDFLIGWETEVVFLDMADLGAASKTHAWSTSQSLHNHCLKALEQIVDALEASGVEVLLFHPESAPSQYEIVTGPLSPLESIDTLYHTRETITRICAHHNIRATLHPKPFESAPGTAAHMHISMSPPTEPLQDSFFAGVLSHLGSLAALTLPHPASYERLKDSCWAGGTWIAWGDENREVPLRRVKKEKAHWEVRCIDGLANSYLAAAGVITAGCMGILDREKLPGESCDSDPSKLTSRERNGLGITKQLPDGIGKAMDLLEADKKLKARIGEACMAKYIITKKAEVAALEDWTTDAGEGKWIINRY
ncbi:glutamine synthetase/guanido kinase [Choiromyces venosus 120613-1]|uniref:Glutamine synthetase n=1 Tax=Choiromyces venosus 120613-1 TaxID=1336337 RepID=A0A3N4JMI1_9PEZI|nr:glutamine synthetase/guanido kinase [Choiromyces venosus 120613-1]